MTVERVVSTAGEARARARARSSRWFPLAAQAALAQDLVRGVCLRVVCDAHDESLSDLTSALDPVGRPRTLRLLRQLVASPGTITALPRGGRTVPQWRGLRGFRRGRSAVPGAGADVDAACGRG
ncbi:MAG: hypothetical protein KIT58_00465 [Planctomycetota bacterium]|nr:hypothetical protein [Planctomycetota bacterium]